MKSSPNLSDKPHPIKDNIVESLSINLDKHDSYAIYGSNDFINSAILAQLHREYSEDIYFVTSNSKKCEILIEHIEQSFNVPTFYLQNEIFHSKFDMENNRSLFLNVISFVEKDNYRKIKFIDEDNLFFPFPKKDHIKSKILKKTDQSWGRDLLIEQLEDFGYKKKEFVEELGDYSVRGSIVDIFLPTYTFPIRIEFYKDLLSSIQSFNLYDGRRRSYHFEQIKIISIKNSFVDTECSDSLLLDSIKSESILIFDSISNFPSNNNRQNKISNFIFKNKTIFLNPIDQPRKTINLNLDIEFSQSLYGNSVDLLEKTIKEKSVAKSVYIVTDSDTENKLKKDIHPKILDRVCFVNGFLQKSFYLKNNKMLFLSFNRINKSISRQQRARDYANLSFKLSSFMDLNTGNLIVHKNFGLCIYKGIKNKIVNNSLVDFIECEFSFNDILLIPIDKINLIQRYVGSSETAKLDSLRNKVWTAKVRKAKKVAEGVAREILSLYAQRKSIGGFSYKINETELVEFESKFEYIETIDQKNAIMDTYQDMRLPKPMDRLICGDVGFGKTEIALRASYLASVNAKQTIIIAPTTPLVYQHLNTFLKRFESFPIRVEGISRFTKTKKITSIQEGLSKGTIDILIGTHKVLSEKLKFKDLGLIIIDEEHKFGVSAKETIKRLKIGIDALSLSATPIPRTLQLSLGGLRDISLIATPPKERLGIETYVEIYNKSTIKNAINYELKRNGRVFFVHNEISSIEKIYKEIKSLFPKEEIDYVHGRMKGIEIENTLKAFIDGTISILITTTIIESGLDIKSVNTMIINNAQNFGLSDLYQLRGRIGRSNIQGIAYFLIPDKKISESAKKRLSAMRRLTKLGSGFNLALEDLEIRGAGNLFGTKQSGKIYDVGIEFYLELLEQEINRVKDNETENLLSPEVIANQDVFIPQSYISSAEKRLFYYKKISLIQHKDDCLEIIEELLDKFGPVPKELLNLIYIAEIKINMKRLGISKLKIKSKSLIIRALKLGKIKNIETEFINLNLELQNIAKLTRKIKNLEDIIKTNYEFRDDKIIIDSATIL